MKVYEVTWRTNVAAKSPQDAAKQARAVMLDPSNTQATFLVAYERRGGVRSLQRVDVQDPDRSDD
jgi:hypothetical protein